MHHLKHKLCFLTALLVIVPTSSFANSWSCTRNDHVREVIIESAGTNAVPCKVLYAKPTEKVETKVLWSANNAKGYCEEKANAFIDKLTELKWTCSAKTGSAMPDDSMVKQ